MARPIQFDRDQVLQKAMDVFWQQGYGATSMTDLAHAMDMRPGSIYGAFVSKQRLFLEALDEYAADAGEWMQQIMQEYPSVHRGLRVIFSRVIDEMAIPSPRGCFVINALLELSSLNEECGDCARKHLQNTQSFIRDQLEKAQRSGELSEDQSVSRSAILLQGTFYSLRVMGKAKASREDLEILVDQSLEAVFGKKTAHCE